MPPRENSNQMANLAGVVQQLKKEHDRLSRQIQGVSAALSAFGAAYGKRTGQRMSAAGRARIAAAQRARWAKVKRSTGKKQVGMSAAGRKKIAAAQRARWAKVNAAKMA